MASLLAGLVQYHDWLATDVIDAVMEDIRLGMEVNNPKFNQRRTAMVKFLAEMYNYRSDKRLFLRSCHPCDCYFISRLIDSSLVFKVLYSLIMFGVVMDPEMALDSLDPPDSMIRSLVFGLELDYNA